jgi:hypothetical protein
MTWLRLTIPALLLSLSAWSSASAQVTVDVSKITCDQFTLYKVTDPRNIAIWLSGYYHGLHKTTVIDTQALADNLKKITDYCNMKPSDTVFKAVETVFGPLN